MTSVSAESVAGLFVSRETIDALHSFEALVLRWNTAINLVSKATLPDLWNRHIVDSAQIFRFCPPKAQHWVDLGSGGGFPGIVIAVLAQQLAPELRVTLVESDLRKATFLRQAIQTLSLSASVLSKRVESVPALAADVVSARALAPLRELLGYASVHLQSHGLAIFPKGARYDAEVAEARKLWSFDVETTPSLSQSDAAVLVIRNIHRAED